MKFVGTRINNICFVFWSEFEYSETPEIPLNLYLDEVNHSPDGFQWGYSGSGPSQLAYAMLRQYTLTRFSNSKEFTQKYYRSFREKFIANIKEDSFVIEESVIYDWMHNILINDFVTN
jgi:hypothetical protein